MAATTKRITFTKTRVFTFTVDIPNYSTVSDADTLVAAKLPNGYCALGELLAGSAANNGTITNADTVGGASSAAWAVSGTGTNIEPYYTWSASTALTAGTRITPSAPTNKLYTASAGTTGTTEPTWPTTVGGTVVSGTVTFTCINKF